MKNAKEQLQDAFKEEIQHDIARLEVIALKKKYYTLSDREKEQIAVYYKEIQKILNKEK